MRPCSSGPGQVPPVPTGGSVILCLIFVVLYILFAIFKISPSNCKTIISRNSFRINARCTDTSKTTRRNFRLITRQFMRGRYIIIANNTCMT